TLSNPFLHVIGKIKGIRCCQFVKQVSQTVGIRSKGGWKSFNDLWGHPGQFFTTLFCFGFLVQGTGANSRSHSEIDHNALDTFIGITDTNIIPLKVVVSESASQQLLEPICCTVHEL
ncbi:hypothetical protein OTU49_007754, partial [Cherax quadricarinatus]